MELKNTLKALHAVMSTPNGCTKEVHEKLSNIYSNGRKAVTDSREALKEDSQLYHMV